MQLTSEQADTLIAAARSKAKTIGIAVSAAVLDCAGHMKAFREWAEPGSDPPISRSEGPDFDPVRG